MDAAARDGAPLTRDQEGRFPAHVGGLATFDDGADDDAGPSCDAGCISTAFAIEGGQDP